MSQPDRVQVIIPIAAITPFLTVVGLLKVLKLNDSNNELGYSLDDLEEIRKPFNLFVDKVKWQEEIEPILQKMISTPSLFELRKGNFFTTKELAELLNVSVAQINKLAFKKIIPCRQIGDKRFFVKEEIERWIDSQKNK